jgi:hypothetical protein
MSLPEFSEIQRLSPGIPALHHMGDTEAMGPTFTSLLSLINHLVSFTPVSCRTDFGSF